MKTRTDFVTNSSSSSFVIAKAALTEKQIRELLYYCDTKEAIDNYDNGWSIREKEFVITGYTIMDNGDISSFMKKIGINPAHVEWD